MEDQFIYCPICNKKGKMLKQHMRVVHGMTPEQFYKEFPNFLLVAPSTHSKRRNFTRERNLKNWKNDEYRGKMTKFLKERDVTWKSNSDDRKAHPEKYSKIAHMGGKKSSELYGQKFLTEGKLNSDKFHKIKSAQMSKLAYSLHHDPKYKDVKKIIEGPKDGNLIEYVTKGGKKVRLRSTFELKTYEFLVSLGIDFEYEPSSLVTKYELSDGSTHHYYPDFVIESLKTVIECKPTCYTKNETFRQKKDSILRRGYKFITFSEEVIYNDKLMKRLIYET